MEIFAMNSQRNWPINFSLLSVCGFSLIEVLVTLVILTVGLVGVFNLHIVSKQGSFESFQQTQAAYLANDIINRIRLNSHYVSQYVGTYSEGIIDSPVNCDSTMMNDYCSGEQVMAWDLHLWQQALIGANDTLNGENVGGLDHPIACIQYNANKILTVIITWKGIRRLSDPNETHQINCGTASLQRRIFILKTAIS